MSESSMGDVKARLVYGAAASGEVAQTLAGGVSETEAIQDVWLGYGIGRVGWLLK